MWGSDEHLALVLHPQSQYMKCFLEIFIYGRGWFGLAGPLQLFLWIRAQGAAVQGQSQTLLTGPDVCRGATGKEVWIAPWQISALPVFGLRSLSHAPDPTEEDLLELPCVNNLIFRPLGLPVRWDRPAHLVSLSSTLPKGCSSGCRLQISFLQDLIAPRCFCEDLLVSAVLYYFFFFPLSNTWDGCICLQAVSGVVYSHRTPVLTCTTAIDSPCRQILNQALLNLQQLR